MSLFQFSHKEFNLATKNLSFLTTPQLIHYSSSIQHCLSSGNVCSPQNHSPVLVYLLSKRLKPFGRNGGTIHQMPFVSALPEGGIAEKSRAASGDFPQTPGKGWDEGPTRWSLVFFSCMSWCLLELCNAVAQCEYWPSMSKVWPWPSALWKQGHVFHMLPHSPYYLAVL